MRYIVAQLGARMHYAVPRILHRNDRLQRLFTDLYFWRRQDSSAHVEKLLPKAFVATLTRYSHQELPPYAVNSSIRTGLLIRLLLRMTSSPLLSAQANIYAARSLTKRLLQSGDLQPGLGIYGFDTASLELFGCAKAQKAFLILEQCVVPRALQQQVLTDRMHAPPLGRRRSQRLAWQLLSERERSEWQLANLVICPSNYVRDALIEQGVSASKLTVVPYGVDQLPSVKIEQALRQRCDNRPRRMRVLFAGEIGYRKGIIDLWEAAGELLDLCEFSAAGRSALPPRLMRKLSNRICLLGKYTRSQLDHEFLNADVFALPTYVEGSATVIYEALRSGLPVITTKSAGSVVENGRSGMVGEAGDVRFLVNSLKTLAENPKLRDSMAEAALVRSREYTVEKYGQRLIGALDSAATSL